MDTITELFDHVHDTNRDKFNPDICNGLAMKHMKRIEGLINRIFRCAEMGFPEGLVYVDCRRCTPAEEYEYVTERRYNSRRQYEITKSDYYLMRFTFRYFEEEIHRYFYIPFVRNGCMIRIMGSYFNISAVAMDNGGLTVTPDFLFLMLLMDKITFKRMDYAFLLDGVREPSYVIYANIYHRNKAKKKEAKPRRIVTMDATPVHYLFCKYGVSETFLRYGDTKVVIGGDEINTVNYPPSEWRICVSTWTESVGKPRGVKVRAGQYVPTRLRLAIPKENYNLTTRGMIGAFFYIADHFPDRLEPEYMDDKSVWTILMGHIAIQPDSNEGKLMLGMESHMESLDAYMDDITRDGLREIGIYVDSLYDFFGYLLKNMHRLMAQSTNNIASMYGKNLNVLRYVTEDIKDGIFKFKHELKKRGKNGTKVLSIKEVRDAMNMFLKPEIMHKINQEKLSVAGVSSPNDQKAFKITTNLILQGDAGGSGGGANMHDPSRFLDASIIEVGSINHLTKSEPTGRGKLNPFLNVGEDGTIIRDPARREVLDRIQEMVQH